MTRAIFLAYTCGQPGQMGHNCNPSTQEAETEGLRVQAQPELHSEAQSQKQANKIEETNECDQVTFFPEFLNDFEAG
jgi:hypothetical protein